jgi:hypothetical protein
MWDDPSKAPDVILYSEAANNNLRKDIDKFIPNFFQLYDPFAVNNFAQNMTLVKRYSSDVFIRKLANSYLNASHIATIQKKGKGYSSSITNVLHIRKKEFKPPYYTFRVELERKKYKEFRSASTEAQTYDITLKLIDRTELLNNFEGKNLRINTNGSYGMLWGMLVENVERVQ